MNFNVTDLIPDAVEEAGKVAKQSLKDAGEAVSDKTKFDVSVENKLDKVLQVKDKEIEINGSAHLGKYGGWSEHVFEFKVDGKVVAYKNQFIKDKKVKFVVKKDGDDYKVDSF